MDNPRVEERATDAINKENYSEKNDHDDVWMNHDVCEEPVVVQKNERSVRMRKRYLGRRLTPPDDGNGKRVSHEVGKDVPSLESEGTASKNAERGNDFQWNVTQHQSKELESYNESNFALKAELKKLSNVVNCNKVLMKNLTYEELENETINNLWQWGCRNSEKS